MRGYKKHQEWIDLGYSEDWSMPSAKDTVKRYSMNADANTVEKIRRMQVLHGFDNPGEAIRRAIDITVRIDQLLPNGGTVITVDDKGVEVPVEIVKVRPE